MSGTQPSPLAGIKVIVLDPRGNWKPPANPMAEKVAANAPLTVRAAREFVYLTIQMGRSAATRAAHSLFEKVYLSEDAREGPRSFREKRKLVWKGR